MTTFTAYIEFDEKRSCMSASCRACRVRTLRLRASMSCGPTSKEVVELCLEEQDGWRERLPKFVGVQQIEVA